MVCLTGWSPCFVFDPNPNSLTNASTNAPSLVGLPHSLVSLFGLTVRSHCSVSLFSLTVRSHCSVFLGRSPSLFGLTVWSHCLVSLFGLTVRSMVGLTGRSAWWRWKFAYVFDNTFAAVPWSVSLVGLPALSLTRTLTHYLMLVLMLLPWSPCFVLDPNPNSLPNASTNAPSLVGLPHCLVSLFGLTVQSHCLVSLVSHNVQSHCLVSLVGHG